MSPHPLQLDPAIWSCLPEEVLEVVFAKLPVSEIHGLLCLSTGWKRKLVERSRFREICAETSSRISALICQDGEFDGLLWVKLYDTGTNKWDLYRLLVDVSDQPFRWMCAADGELVCFLSAWHPAKTSLLRVIICNPLTQHVKELVLKGRNTHQVEVLQIVTDRDTHHYKLIVGWRKRSLLRNAPDDVHFIVDMFDSKTEEWTLDSPGDDQLSSRELILGVRYNWLGPEGLDHIPKRNSIAPSVWDCDDMDLYELSNIPIREDVRVDYALLKDRLFVLQKVSKMCFVDEPDYRGNNGSETSDNDDGDVAMPSLSRINHYCISEYQGQTDQPNWVRLRTICCGPLTLPPATTGFQMRLHACEEFLVVVAVKGKWWSDDYFEIGWLYDFSTDAWRVLPSLPRGVRLLDLKDNLLCELHWDVDLNPLNVPDAKQVRLPVVPLSDEIER